MKREDIYMQRCLELARLGTGFTAPNPMVGAVLVYQDRIIGEGYHEIFGGPHAEVNCLAAVLPADRDKIPHSELFVSLEPCAHQGKTPPCTALILANRIGRVWVGVRDPFPAVAGRGIEQLRQGGVQVETGILEQSCRELNKRFFTFHTQHRPYVILKWAQTADRILAAGDFSRLSISNELSNRLVHRWRSEEAAILVGTNTAAYDNPALTTRLWKGRSPVRLVLDLDLRLQPGLQVFDGAVPTLIFNTKKNAQKGLLQYIRIQRDQPLVHQLMRACYEQGLLSLLVEGGTRMLQAFIDEGIWDEARVISNKELLAGAGIGAPLLGDARLTHTYSLLADEIQIFKP